MRRCVHCRVIYKKNIYIKKKSVLFWRKYKTIANYDGIPRYITRYRPHSVVNLHTAMAFDGVHRFWVLLYQLKFKVSVRVMRRDGVVVVW